MSNIPNSAMPHTGANTQNAGSSTSQQSSFATGPSGSAPQNAGSSASMQGDDFSSEMQGDRFSGQPLQQDRFSETSYSARGRDSGGVMEKARDNKTGIALGVAVGAIAAAAIPFMLSGKKKSNQRRDDYSAAGHSRADTRTASASGSTKPRF